MLLAVMSGSSYPTPELLLFLSAFFETQIQENLFSQSKKCVCSVGCCSRIFFFLEELKM